MQAVLNNAEVSLLCLKSQQLQRLLLILAWLLLVACLAGLSQNVACTKAIEYGTGGLCALRQAEAAARNYSCMQGLLPRCA